MPRKYFDSDEERKLYNRDRARKWRSKPEVKERQRILGRIRYHNNREHEQNRQMDWLAKHPLSGLARSMKYYWKNKALIHARQKARRANDVAYRLKCRLKGRIRSAVKRASGLKAKKSMDLLGCTMPDFLIYIESKFDVGMSWQNYGLWEIDHIMPCALFDLSKPEHQKRCFHFSNLQPLWRNENRRKCDKMFGRSPDHLSI